MQGLFNPSTPRDGMAIVSTKRFRNSFLLRSIQKNVRLKLGFN